MKKHRPRPRKPKRKKSVRDVKFDPAPGAWYHGGRGGLAVGSYLTPPRERGERVLERGLEETCSQAVCSAGSASIAAPARPRLSKVKVVGPSVERVERRR